MVVILLPVLIAGCVVAFVLVRRVARRQDERHGGCCGRCGYSARGLTTFTCPECGSDLREIGIFVPGMNNQLWCRGSISRMVTTWTIMLALIAVPISYLVHRYCLPTVYSSHQDYRLVAPVSGQYKQVDFHSHGYHLDWPYRQPQRSLILDGVDITLTGNDDRTIRMQATIDQFGYDYINAEGRRVLEASGLTGAVVLDWMRSAGVDVKRPGVAAEAEEIAQVVHDATYLGMNAPRKSVFGGRTLGGQATYASPPRIAQPITAFVWLTIWLLGVWRIFRSQRSAQAGPTSVTTHLAADVDDR